MTLPFVIDNRRRRLGTRTRAAALGFENQQERMP
jgi:hypothetical protein